MKKVFLTSFVASVALTGFISCSSDDDGSQIEEEEQIEIENPATYVFERDGESTVDFNGQTTRLKMGSEFVSALSDNSKTAEELLAMFAHEEGNTDFSEDALNASDKSIKSKTAASRDFFASNSSDQATIRADFDTWISAQVDEVFASWEVEAAPGVAGQVPQGERVRYVNADGLEYNQMIAKGLIGALTLDQILNNYLSPAVLDESENKANNDADILEDGKSYTTMEHKWDEAYGYLFALNSNQENPVEGENDGDRFLGSYIGQVADDPDFSDLITASFEAFKLGRAAIVTKNYEVRDAQTAIIREKLSLVPSVRGVYYLQSGKNSLAEEVPSYGAAFHAISEGFGFIYSLQFTHDPATGAPYMAKAEVDALLEDLLGDGENGLWDVTGETLDAISTTIATKFGFTVEEASSTE